MQNTLKNILVTGGAGYIGSACVAALLKAGHTVTVFDDFSTGQRDKVPAGATVIKGDLTDAAAINAALDGASFDAVLHLAAKKAVGESEAKPSAYLSTSS
jgi:UDP-glucose 4-epimerase